MKSWLLDHWTNLNERERWTLGLGTGFCFLYLLYYFLYSPLVTAVHTHSQQWIEKQETLRWMQQIRQEYPQEKTAKSLTGSQFLTVLDDYLDKTSFRQFNHELQQTGVGDIKLSYDQVPYVLFFDGLRTFNQEYVFSVKQLTVESTDTPGVVKLAIVLSIH